MAIDEKPVSFRAWVGVMGTILGAFMAVLDIQITNSSLNDITGGISATQDEGSWISTSYLIGEIVTIPLTAWLSRVFSVFELRVNEHLAPHRMLHEKFFQPIAELAASVRPIDDSLIKHDPDADVAALERNPPTPPTI